MSNDPTIESVIDIDVATGAPETDDSQRFTKSDIRHNMFCCITLDATRLMGLEDSGLALAPLLAFLKASNYLVGWVYSIRVVALLGILVSPWITRRFKYKKWYMLSFNVPCVAAWGILGLVIVMSHRLGVSNAWLLWFIMAMVGTSHLLTGFVNLPAMEFIASCIPMSHRGRMFGVGLTVGAIGGIAAISVGGWILAHYAKPMSFGYLFILMWFLTTVGFVFAAFAKEKPTPVEKSPKAWSKDMLRAAWNNKPFVRYLLFTALQMIVGTVFGFVSFYAFRELKAPAPMAAVFSMIYTVARICTSSLGGVLADKFGPKRMISFWPLQIILPSIPLLLLHNIWGVLIFFGLWASIGACFVGTDTVIQFSLPKSEHRAGHFTILMLVQYACAAAGPVVGYMCDLLPYRTMFLAGAIAGILMIPYVRWFASTLGNTPEAYS